MLSESKDNLRPTLEISKIIFYLDNPFKFRATEESSFNS